MTDDGWHQVNPEDVPDDGRVRTAIIDGRSVALSRCGALLGALENHGVAAAAVFDALSRHMPADAVVTVDVGNHAYSLGRYVESKGQPVLTSGYLGSIGFGYPAALGAWAAAPGRPIVAVTGDGGFGQYAMELTTAVKYGIGIKHVLLNNNALGRRTRPALRGTGRRAALTRPSPARRFQEDLHDRTRASLRRPTCPVHQLHPQTLAGAQSHRRPGRCQPPHHGEARRRG
jgi:hypothetical protein